MDKVKKWVWQHENYPEFDYRYEEIAPLISSVSRNTGKLEYAAHILDQKDLNDIVIDTATNEIIQSSEIEGEILDRDSVRSSIRKKLGNPTDESLDHSTRHSDGLADILIDSSFNPAPLNEKRLNGWHNALFPTGYSGGYKINVAKYRRDEMRVVSHRGYREIGHYEAPSPEHVGEEMKKLLVYINHSQEDPYIKSAVAHLWFVIIHPYDDGNGRIARNIVNYILAKELGLNHQYFSISNMIAKEKRSYYDILERSNNLIYNRNFDFTEWIAWHTDAVDRAIEHSLLEIEKVVQKAKFWDQARHYALNDRQIKVLNKMLDKGVDAFEGALSTKKYAAITKTSIPSAKRDISRLVEYGLLRQVKGTAGRNIRYEVVVLEDRPPAS
ncbi:DUF4172 domain-containing protein [Nitratifractor sp.]|uniref:Fic family protein n=1 Tax=Nitratifractor sp. TaxID=2268144 RepID=UPI0025D3B0F8|nr:DUF4172 domain-containing protein [Nitratifractor sp.]